MKRTTLCVCALVLGVTTHLSAQTSINPDLSVIGDFRALISDDPAFPKELDRFNLGDPMLELVVGGYLNPYARADLTVAWHTDATAEIEELYATFLRGLPLGTNLRIGQYLLEYGRLNPIHPHAYSFILRPLPQTVFFGEEGLNAMAVRGAWLLPTGDVYTEVMGSALKGDVLAGHHHEHDEEDEEEPTYPVAWFGRLTTSIGVSDNTEFSLGASGMTSIYDAEEQLRAYIVGADLKYHWRPTRFKSFTLEGEILVNHRTLESGEELTTLGGYMYFDYRFRQRYNVGIIGEYTQGALDAGARIARAGVFLGFAPVEETALFRLVGHWTEPKGADGFYSVIFQLVFGLGPHQPHNF